MKQKNNEEFNLSDCLRCNAGTNKDHIRDVKEFIKRLKEAGNENDWDIMLMDGEDGDIIISFNEWIDKLVGFEND